MPCPNGCIPHSTRIQAVSSVSMSRLAPDTEGKASVPTLLHVPHRQIWAALGTVGGRWPRSSSFASLFPPCWQGGRVLTWHLQILLKQLQFRLSSMRIQLGLFLLQHWWSPVFSLSVCALIRYCTKRKVEMQFVFDKCLSIKALIRAIAAWEIKLQMTSSEKCF